MQVKCGTAYYSLARLIPQSHVLDKRITTHPIVDRSEQRIDLRSFNFDKVFNLLRYYRQPIATKG
jgi:hypothetical protein